ADELSLSHACARPVAFEPIEPAIPPAMVGLGALGPNRRWSPAWASRVRENQNRGEIGYGNDSRQTGPLPSRFLHNDPNDRFAFWLRSGSSDARSWEGLGGEPDLPPENWTTGNGRIRPAKGADSMRKSRFSEPQIVHILRQADVGEKTIGQLCRD